MRKKLGERLSLSNIDRKQTWVEVDLSDILPVNWKFISNSTST